MMNMCYYADLSLSLSPTLPITHKTTCCITDRDDDDDDIALSNLSQQILVSAKYHHVCDSEAIVY